MSEKPAASNIPGYSRRPRWGWLAWEATVGYVSRYVSPDAALKIEIYPMTHIVGWAASLLWQDRQETVRDAFSFADVLTRLWERVDQYSGLDFASDARVRMPHRYGDDEWLDQSAYRALSLLVNTTDTFFSGDWSIVIVYRPLEVPDSRFHARLIAQEIAVNRGATKSTLRDVCRTLYLNALPDYRRFQQQSSE
jgi:hypothetical protein